MKLKVYQINMDLDKHNTAFLSYDNAIKTAGIIDSSIYKCVFDGNIEANDLEQVFEILNENHPVGYNGHSLSVSDIVETETEIYFCDTIGFKKLKDFDSSKCEPIIGHKMLVIEPHKVPYEMVIPDNLEALQQAVQGYIECTYPFDDNVFVIGNEEAKLIGLEGNRHINKEIYAGNLLLAADDGYGGTMDLTEDQIHKYSERFKTPESISPEEIQNSVWYKITDFNFYN